MSLATHYSREGLNVTLYAETLPSVIVDPSNGIYPIITLTEAMSRKKLQLCLTYGPTDYWQGETYLLPPFQLQTCNPNSPLGKELMRQVVGRTIKDGPYEGYLIERITRALTLPYNIQLRT